MKSHVVIMEPDGFITIPVEYMKALGLVDGDSVTVKIKDDFVSIRRRPKRKRKAQNRQSREVRQKS